jgi:dTDP-4-dehydrorhamnose 3,5-epimerase
MQPTSTLIPGVILLDPAVFEDERGYFMETYHLAKFREAGIDCAFVQDNHSRSRRGAVRGLHYQIQHPQGKLIRVVRGEIYDVAVDLRRRSPTFGRWTAAYLSEENRRQAYLPPGMAHGFCTVSEVADVVYKCTDFYHRNYERTLLWNDRELSIDWPISRPILSEKDRQGTPLAAAECYE